MENMDDIPSLGDRNKLKLKTDKFYQKMEMKYETREKMEVFGHKVRKAIEKKCPGYY